MPTFDALESAQGRSLAIKGYESDLVAQAKEHLTTGLDGLRVASQIATTRIGYLTKLYEVTDPPADMALLVTGGLGRGIASPHSDLDIVFLSPDPEAERNRTFLERFLYPLWDAGLTIGHSLHTPESYVALGETEISVLTSILDRRWIAGSEGLARALDALATTTLKEPSYRKLMLDAIRSWTQGVNSATSHRLEPDIKGGAGGLRTLHEVWWAARYIWGVNHWRELLTETPLEANDVDILMYGFRLLLEVRLALHFESPRRQDTLRFEFQSGV